MIIGFYQFRPMFGKAAANTRKIIRALAKVKADLIVLPELALSGYYFRDDREALALAEDPWHSPCIDSLSAFCRDKRLHAVIGFAEKNKDKCFNSAALIGPRGIIHIYRKLHLFDKEKQWMSPGDIPLQLNRVNGIKLGIMICFDWFFPETARTLALQGAQIICHPSNLVLPFCQQTMLSRCLENGVFAVTANRYGADKRPFGTLKFTGKSQIVSPRGDLIHRAAAQRDTLFITEIDPEQAHDKSITQNNHLFSDRRPEFYIHGQP